MLAATILTAVLYAEQAKAAAGLRPYRLSVVLAAEADELRYCAWVEETHWGVAGAYTIFVDPRLLATGRCGKGDSLRRTMAHEVCHILSDSNVLRMWAGLDKKEADRRHRIVRRCAKSLDKELSKREHVVVLSGHHE